MPSPLEPQPVDERPRFRIRALGGASVDGPDGPLSGIDGQRKLLALLILVAAAGKQGISREKVVAYLWSDSSAVQGSNAISQALFRVRRLLGDETLTGVRELRLNPSTISCDVVEFEDRLNAGDIEGAVELYTGAFLDGFYVRGAGEFERWSSDERQRLLRRFVDALRGLAERASAAGQHVAAAAWWRRRLDAEPFDARAARGYAESLAAAGDREAALQFAATFKRAIQEDLGAAAIPEFDASIERIRTSGVTDVSLPSSAPGAQRADAPAAAGKQGVPALRPVAAPSPTVPTVPTRRRPNLQRVMLLSVGVTLAIVAMLAVTRPRGRSDAGVPVVVVAPFESLSDTSSMRLARVAEQVVVQAIPGSGLVGVVDVDMATRVLPVAVHGDSGSAAATAQLVARVGARLVVETRFDRRADTLEMRPTILDPADGHVLAVPQAVEIETSTDPSRGLSELADGVTGALAVLVDRRIATMRDASAAAPRFEAYKEYVEGLDAFVGRWTGRNDYNGAIVHFARAAQLDTNFNLPLVCMMYALGNSGQPERGDSVRTVLAARRARLSPLEKLSLEFSLANRRSPRLEVMREQHRIAVAGAALAPESNWTYLRGFRALALQRFDEAARYLGEVDAANAWIENWSGFWNAYDQALHSLGRFDDEAAMATRAPRYTHDLEALTPLFRVLGTKGDAAGVTRLADSLASADPDSTGPNALNLVVVAANEAAVHEHRGSSAQIARLCIRQGRDQLKVGGPPAALARVAESVGDCASLIRSWALADSMYSLQSRYGDDDGRLWGELLVALRRGDSATFRADMAQANQRPSLGPNTGDGLWLGASIAAIRGDARSTAEYIRRAEIIEPTWWHEDPDIAAVFRRAPEFQALVAGPL